MAVLSLNPDAVFSMVDMEVRGQASEQDGVGDYSKLVVVKLYRVSSYGVTASMEVILRTSFTEIT
jgi:hypothetical protein